MGASGVSPPAVLLDELKSYLRIEGAEEDALLLWLLRAATEAVEAWLGWLLIEREVEERRTVTGGEVALQSAPARSLVSVTDTDASVWPGALQVSRFGVGRVTLAGLADGADVTVRYRAGLSTDWNGLPEPVRLGVLRAAAHFHAHRDAGTDAGLPPAVARLVSPWRARRML